MALSEQRQRSSAAGRGQCVLGAQGAHMAFSLSQTHPGSATFADASRTGNTLKHTPHRVRPNDTFVTLLLKVRRNSLF